MKKIFLVLLILPLILSSCRGKSPTEKALREPLEGAHIDRIIITSTRNAAKYTIVDSKSISRIKSTIEKGRDAKEDMKLEPDFTFQFYDGRKEIMFFNYIAGVNDKDIVNLIDDKKTLYHIDTSIENEFLKRIMRKTTSKNVPEYYISLLELIIEKTNVAQNSTVVVDITKDYTVTKGILSVEQKRILDSVDKRGIKVKFPKEVETYNYYIKINTTSYTDVSSKTIVTVKDKTGSETKYNLEGKYDGKRWSYFIRFK